MMMWSVLALLLTPVTNTLVRYHEAQADYFGVNAAREPDGFAQIALKLGEYSKLSPSPLEEAIFYDHPSGRTRILMAMRWKAQHLANSEGK
jgi:STE24 endopeptidase